MRKFKDDRGRSYNDVFPEIGKGDINMAILYPGTIKAFHRHQNQDDYWFIISGHVRAILANDIFTIQAPITTNEGVIVGDGGNTLVTNTTKVSFNYPKVAEHYLSEGDLLFIPRGTWHGVQCLGNEPAIMIYHITNKYNEEEPDEERKKWNEYHNWEFSRK